MSHRCDTCAFLRRLFTVVCVLNLLPLSAASGRADAPPGGPGDAETWGRSDAVFPAWWATTTGRRSSPTNAGESGADWVYASDVYEHTTNSSNGHEWVGSPANLLGPPDGVTFGANSGPYQGSSDWVYLDVGEFLPAGAEGCWLGFTAYRYTFYTRQVWDGTTWRTPPGWHNLDCAQFAGGNNNMGFHSNWGFRYVRFQALMGYLFDGYWRLDGIAVEAPDSSTALYADQTCAPGECPFGRSTPTTDWQGGSINTRTGNLHYDRQDFSIPTLGQSLRLERSYNSLLVTGSVVYSQPLGYGWTHNVDAQLVFPGMAGGGDVAAADVAAANIPTSHTDAFRQNSISHFRRWAGPIHHSSDCQGVAGKRSGSHLLLGRG